MNSVARGPQRPVPGQVSGRPNPLNTRGVGILKLAGQACFLSAAVLVLAICAVAAPPQTGQETARTIARPQAFASLDPVPRHRIFEVAVVAHIQSAYHINAHKTLDPYLIPTEVQAHFPPGYRVLSTDYPEGELVQFSFSKKKLAVYTGQMTVKMKVEAEATAPLGPQDLSLSFHYQACNNTMCLPPVTVPVSLHLTVAKAGSRPKPVHPEIFHR